MNTDTGIHKSPPLTRREFRAKLRSKAVPDAVKLQLLVERRGSQSKPHPLGNRAERRRQLARYRTGKMSVGAPVLDALGGVQMVDGQILRHPSEMEAFRSRLESFVQRHPADKAARRMLGKVRRAERGGR